MFATTCGWNTQRSPTPNMIQQIRKTWRPGSEHVSRLKAPVDGSSVCRDPWSSDLRVRRGFNSAAIQSAFCWDSAEGSSEPEPIYAMTA